MTMTNWRSSTAFLLLITILARGTRGDGTGLIGWGKTLYNPTCTFACRYAIRSQPLTCTPTQSSENYGTAHHTVTTPPSCYIGNAVFLKTVALCIDTYCRLAGNPSMSLIESYWMEHLGTGTVGTRKYVPSMLYLEALVAAREDEEIAATGTNTTVGNSSSSGEEHSHTRKIKARHDGHGITASSGMKTFDVTSPLPITKGGKGVLNVTSFVDPEVWQLGYNYMLDFEINENGHSTMTIIIIIVAIFLPILLSLPRLIPEISRSSLWNEIQRRAIYPATWGSHHRVPVAGAVIPNRGQALYISLISFLNIILLLAPYVHHQPQASFTSLTMQTISIVGNRAGVMAMGNVIVLFLFAARNNPLLYLTDWSYGTYLLLHRWLGYWAIIQTIIHSFMLMAHYMIQGTYKAELARPYWVWGIVGTVFACAILPFSHLWVRRKIYEFFLLTHIVFSLLFLLGYYYHIWYVYGYKWGYEIWMFVAGGIWGLDRVLRVMRMAVQGSRTAVVKVIEDAGGEYFRIDVEGKQLDGGVAYLCFPTMSWRFWETHPFSVAFASDKFSEEGAKRTLSGAVITVSGELGLEKENSEPQTTKQSTEITSSTPVTSIPLSNSGDSSTTFIARAQTGITHHLLSHATKQNGTARIRVLIDGPYHHSGHVRSQLSPCNSILCIAGGVGITSIIPYLQNLGNNKPAKLFWSSRKTGLVNELRSVLDCLPRNVEVETKVGERFDLGGLLRRELSWLDPGGKDELLGVIVCGPPSMADDVRRLFLEISRDTLMCRPYVLIDEAFSW